MSTAGTYNYRPKVDNPRAIFQQMTSDNQLPPFYFGGSQVPINLGIFTGSGITKKYHSAVEASKIKLGRGLSPYNDHTLNIKLPRHYMRK